MSLINIFLSFSLFIIPCNAYSENEKEESTPAVISSFKQAVDTSWSEKLTPLAHVVGEKWAFIMTHTTPHTNLLKDAVKETWSKALNDSQAGKDITDAQSAISTFITKEVSDTKTSASHSMRLIENGKLIDGIWFLSTQLLKDTDNNLANAVQKSDLIHTLGKVTATHYGGSQGAAAYASWYAYKETKNPETALKVGILSGSSIAGFNPINQQSMSEKLRNKILSGVMAGLNAAVMGGDENVIKDVFLNAGFIDETETRKENSIEKILPSLQKIPAKENELAELPITNF